MCKRIYNTLRGNGEPTKALAIQTLAIRRRMERLKKTGCFTSEQLQFMHQRSIAKMERELGFRPKEYEKEVEEQSAETEKSKTKIRTILWP